MSEYQRFVSYLYEYKNNRKTQNRGFLKAESRNGYFKLEIHIKDTALTPGIPIEIYGYLREQDSLFGVPLGSSQSQNGVIQCFLDSPCNFTDFPSVTFSSLKGIIILCNGIFSYASAWDDIPINPETFSTTKSQPHLVLETEAAKLTVEEVTSPVSPWATIMEKYEHFNPFTDDFIPECVKIDLKDLPSLRRERWLIGNNPFIIRAYTEHQHFILGHILSDSQDAYIFGIPGTYNPKEKFMAEMYGFPYFKSVQPSTNSTPCFGYWYRPLA